MKHQEEASENAYKLVQEMMEDVERGSGKDMPSLDKLADALEQVGRAGMGRCEAVAHAIVL